MSKKLDLRALEQPTLELTLLDDAGTTLRLIAPDVDLIERFQAAAPKLKKVADTNDARAIRACFDLFADIISNNLEGVEVTAEELRDKYRLRFVHLLFIARDYLGFINEINHEKN